MTRSITPIIVFALIFSLILGSPFAGTLHYLFPVMAIVTGLILFRLSPATYISFTLWLYFLTPILRRLVDFRSSYLDPSPILLAPLLVTALSVFGLLRKVPSLLTKEYLPHWLALAAILYGFGVGICLAPVTEVSKSLVLWLVPLVWGVFLTTLDKPRESTRHLLSVNFKWAWLVLGLYGVFQYVLLPPWDLAWLEHMIGDKSVFSFGDLASGQIRIWSTMNGPAVFGNFQMAFLLITIAETKPVDVIAIIVGGIAFLLTQIRATWMGACLGILCLLLWQRGRRLTISAGLLAIGLTISGIGSLPPFRDALLTRLQTLSGGLEDGSLQERKTTQENLISRVETNPLGLGLAPQLGNETNDNGIDSGIFTALLSLGWSGALAFWASLGVLLVACFRNISTSSALCIGFRAVFVACLFQMPFSDIYSGAAGIILWSSIALAELTGARRIGKMRQKPQGAPDKYAPLIAPV